MPRRRQIVSGSRTTAALPEEPMYPRRCRSARSRPNPTALEPLVSPGAAESSAVGGKGGRHDEQDRGHGQEGQDRQEGAGRVEHQQDQAPPSQQVGSKEENPFPSHASSYPKGCFAAFALGLERDTPLAIPGEPPA